MITEKSDSKLNCEVENNITFHKNEIECIEFVDSKDKEVEQNNNNNMENNNVSKVKARRVLKVRSNDRGTYLKEVLEPKYLQFLSQSVQTKYQYKTVDEKFRFLRLIEKKMCEESEKINATINVNKTDILSHIIGRRLNVEYLDVDFTKLKEWFKALTSYRDECEFWIRYILEDKCQQCEKECLQELQSIGLN